MKQRCLYVVLFLLAWAITAQAQPIDTLSGNISANLTLFRTTKYVLSGFVYVDSGITLTIEPGTIIYGEKATKGSLIIQRGGKIIADGTSTQPIIFTSESAPGLRAPGDWGGIIICGRATINVPGGVATIEGGVGSFYGGPDDNDDSGILRYVRIEFPGIAFLPNNEINGLTMGGVGRNTVIEHVQVSYSGDDSFEWFGGTVNAKYLVAYKGLDDDFDTDFGFRGKIQFAFSLRDPNIADISGSNGFESDNDGTGTTNAPRTSPFFSNATLVGPQPDTSAPFNALYRRGMHLRRSTQTSAYNSVVIGWPVGMLLDGANVAADATGDVLQIRNSIWGGLRVLSNNGLLDNDGSFDATTWYDTPAYGNRKYIQPDSVGLIDPFNATAPDPRPGTGTPAASGADFTNPRLTDPFFTPTTYVGAFDPSLPREQQWDAGWTEYNPQKYYVPSPIIVLSGHITSNTTLTNDKRYLLSGFVYVDSGVTITIERGTVIYGEKITKGTLIIDRGGKIIADGTASAPIIFTSEQPIGLRAPGDWGGIIICGRATINVPGGVATIEGGVGSFYGGPDDNDDSGILRYVRIEFPGIAFLPNNEINGLTMGGVGRNTVIEHVQVSYSGDDSFEWFGGTVNAKYLVAYKGLDDDFDTDFGFRGKIQFAFSLRDPNIADISGSNGFESDNDGTGTTNAPRTSPFFSNATLVGPQPDTSAPFNALYRRGMHLRRSTQTSAYNSVVIGWPVGMLLDGANVAADATGDVLQIRNSIWGGLRVLSNNGLLDNDGSFDATTWYDTPAYGNRKYIQPDSVGLIDPFNATAPDPRPGTGTPAASGADFTNPRLTDPFFTPTTYVGAFDPSLPREQQWDANWTNYNPQYAVNVSRAFNISTADGWNIISVPVENLPDYSFTTIIPTATSNAFEYNSGYLNAASATPGKGYWMKFSGSSKQTIDGGNDLLYVTVPVNPKWNIIGSVAQPVDVSTIVITPSGNLSSSYFGYDPVNGYSAVTTLEPGQGFWVKMNSAGSVAISAGVFGKSTSATEIIAGLNEVTIRDRNNRSQKLYFGQDVQSEALSLFEMPPSPPAGSFDARFTTQRMVEQISHGQEITITSAAFPVTISWKNNGGNSGTRYALTYMTKDGKKHEEQFSGYAGSVRVIDPSAYEFAIELVNEMTVPERFALGQNYPNPFNPTTRIAIDVPKDALVEISIYNVLGQKVTTLLNNITAAGIHTIEWNGTNSQGNVVPSGTYFVRMSSDSFNAVRKMMLMK